MRIELEGPYKDVYKVGYKVFHRKERRYYLQLVKIGSTKVSHTIAYAKYIMSIKLGDFIPEDMEVDHIDNNKTNDNIDNLQLLSKEANVKKSNTTGRTIVTLICPVCNKEFIREKRLTHLGSKKRKPTCCSRKCGGKASHLIR